MATYDSPSDWSIVMQDPGTGTIQAVNHKTGEVFNGLMTDFNATFYVAKQYEVDIYGMGAVGGSGSPPDGPLIIKSAVPCIIGANSDVGSNGVITLSGALPYAYPNAWYYLKQDVAYTGAPAGMYYVEFSTTTAGIIYDHRLDFSTGQLPYIPATKTPIVFARGTIGNYNMHTAAMLEVARVKIPSTDLTVNSHIHIHAGWSRNQGSSNFYNNAVISAPGENNELASLRENIAGGVKSVSASRRFVLRGRYDRQYIRNMGAGEEQGSTIVPNYLSVDCTAGVDVAFYAGNTITGADCLVLEEFAITVSR